MHGEAIAIGFICEAFLSEKKNGLKKEELSEIVKTIQNTYPAYKLNKTSYSDLLDIMKNDKKNNAGQISFSLLSEIGKCGYDIYCTEEEIFESLDYYISCS